MKRTSLALLIVAILLFSTVLSSCGAGKAEMDYAADRFDEVLHENSSGMSDSYFSSAESFDKIVDSLERPLEGQLESVPSTGGQNQTATDYTEKIIKDVNMSTETREFERALSEIRAAASVCGGYEQSVNTTGRSYNSGNTYCRIAKMVLRIPAEKLDEFLGQVGSLVNVTNQSANTTNVTVQYYDIQSRIGVLQSEKAAYEEMLKKSDDVKYLLQIKDRLYNVIEEIESYETQLRMYDNKVAYSTVTMSLEEVIEYSPIVTPKDTFGTRIENAFRESWNDFSNGFQGFVVWFVYAIPTILIFAAIAGGIAAVVLVSSRRAKARAKKNPETKNS